MAAQLCGGAQWWTLDSPLLPGRPKALLVVLPWLALCREQLLEVHAVICLWRAAVTMPTWSVLLNDGPQLCNSSSREA